MVDTPGTHRQQPANHPLGMFPGGFGLQQPHHVEVNDVDFMDDEQILQPYARRNREWHRHHEEIEHARALEAENVRRDNEQERIRAYRLEREPETLDTRMRQYTQRLVSITHVMHGRVPPLGHREALVMRAQDGAMTLLRLRPARGRDADAEHEAYLEWLRQQHPPALNTQYGVQRHLDAGQEQQIGMLQRRLRDMQNELDDVTRDRNTQQANADRLRDDLNQAVRLLFERKC